MLKRIITAAIGLVLLVLVLIFSDTLAFPITCCALTLIGVYEMLGCIRVRKNLVTSILMYLVTVAAFVLSQLKLSLSVFICTYASMLFILLIVLFAMSVFSEGHLPVDKVCIAFTTVAYIITGLISLVLLRNIEYGVYLYLIPFVGPWVSDTFAYFGGRLFGRHKLIPSVSPKKTVEGAVCGVVFCTAVCSVYGIVIRNYSGINYPVWAFIVMGAIVAVVSQVGDLIFSLIKRRYNVKDYGMILPGHGGVLDRFDSVISTAPLLFIVCEALIVFKLI